MTSPVKLPVEEVLAGAAGRTPVAGGEEIGRSREGRALIAWRLGSGPLQVSLIAGCHADEPVGPAMLWRLVSYLGALPTGHPALAGVSWRIVPQVNPDGARRNADWVARTVPAEDHRGEADQAFDLAPYLRGVVRELPGDDVEFGFPRHAGDHRARPENRAVARFLSAAAPLHLHASFHGMAFAPGPWFLIEEAWVERTEGMRESLRRRVLEMGYRLYDVDRGGEKGFRRIDRGFSTRPDSRAMADHFAAQGDRETAKKFRPSSMELARSLGGDPLTFVSEMPLFLLPPEEESGEAGEPPRGQGSEGRRRIHLWLSELAAEKSAQQVRFEAAAHGIRAMPIRDQMRLQLSFLNQALAAVVEAETLS